ncbi:hypothetical protein Pat9b_5085 (plasmid) [Pantoea sp. At-9b]|nr:hypothetical protein Pat9b_5085 [Pantoea sp. At-9b]
MLLRGSGNVTGFTGPMAETGRGTPLPFFRQMITFRLQITFQSVQDGLSRNGVILTTFSATPSSPECAQCRKPVLIREHRKSQVAIDTA